MGKHKKKLTKINPFEELEMELENKSAEIVFDEILSLKEQCRGYLNQLKETEDAFEVCRNYNRGLLEEAEKVGKNLEFLRAERQKDSDEYSEKLSIQHEVFSEKLREVERERDVFMNEVNRLSLESKAQAVKFEAEENWNRKVDIARNALAFLTGVVIHKIYLIM